MTHLPRFADPAAAADLLARMAAEMGAAEFALVRNPTYVAQPFDLYALAPRRDHVETLDAVVCDMDGTLTTTEALCLHSLGHMVRQITGRMDPAVWPGLDRERDYPHIIGNSTTRHVEYLVETYRDAIDAEAFVEAFKRAAAWTLAEGRDPDRRIEVAATMKALDGGERLRRADFADQVRAAVDIYYARYHQILASIAQGISGDSIPGVGSETGAIGGPHAGCAGRGVPRPVRSVKTLSGRADGAHGEDPAGQVRPGHTGEDPAGQVRPGHTAPDFHRFPPDFCGRRLIEPMPGVGVFIALVKGWLGAEAWKLAGRVIGSSADGKLLTDLGARFERRPAKLAVVTSSIRYEAEIVLGEVVRLVRDEMAHWPVSADRRSALREHAAGIESMFDAFITASDSSEIRLKPHRDLYSLALHRLGVPKARYGNVLGLEDSESGTIAIRAAGIGLCCAVPFSDTAGHDLSAACYVARDGLPEVVLQERCFLR